MTDTLSSSQALQNAYTALRHHDRSQARYWASEAARLDPVSEEPWLILAAVASPEASITYLKKALEINPNSVRARKGMHWAVQRQRSNVYGQTQRINTGNLAETHRTAVQKRLYDLADTIRLRVIRPVNSPTRLPTTAKNSHFPVTAVLSLTALFLVICLGLVMFAGFSSFWTVLAQDNHSAQPVGRLIKSSLTPTATITSTPTPTATPTNTPTRTPKPTHTPVPTQPPVIQPQQAVIQPQYQQPMPQSSGKEGRWIDVNLSTQTVYAYEGDQIVNTFLVSTGTWNHPTVTGQYRIYVKYRYDDMRGPNYNLPNVPYVMYFYSGYSLHGTYWHHNFGTPMSHGCVNMRTEDAAWMYNWSSVGTLVNIHY